MAQSIAQALNTLTTTYIQTCQNELGHLPMSQELADIESPCAVEQTPDGVLWKAVQREEWADFTNVENGIELAINGDVKSYFGCQYAGDITASWQDKPLTLIQVWSDDDFVRLQENLLGHLVTQRRLKLKPTLFIGTIESEIDVISVCNLTGNVLLERLGTDQREVLAETLIDFLESLKVEVVA